MWAQPSWSSDCHLAFGYTAGGLGRVGQTGRWRSLKAGKSVDSDQVYCRIKICSESSARTVPTALELMRDMSRLYIGASPSKHLLVYLINCSGRKFEFGNLGADSAQAGNFGISKGTRSVAHYQEIRRQRSQCLWMKVWRGYQWRWEGLFMTTQCRGWKSLPSIVSQPVCRSFQPSSALFLIKDLDHFWVRRVMWCPIAKLSNYLPQWPQLPEMWKARPWRWFLSWPACPILELCSRNWTPFNPSTAGIFGYGTQAISRQSAQPVWRWGALGAREGMRGLEARA